MGGQKEEVAASGGKPGGRLSANSYCQYTQETVLGCSMNQLGVLTTHCCHVVAPQQLLK